MHYWDWCTSETDSLLSQNTLLRQKWIIEKKNKALLRQKYYIVLRQKCTIETKCPIEIKLHYWDLSTISTNSLFIPIYSSDQMRYLDQLTI